MPETTLIIDMPCGVAGDMLLGALVALGADLPRIERDLLALNVGPIRVRSETVTPGGLRAIRIDVAAPQDAAWQQPPAHAAVMKPHLPGTDHGHRPYHVIRDLIAAAALPARVKDRAQRVFHALARAEGEVHGVAAEVVVFHEVGGLDAIADVVGCCLALEQLDVARVLSGPLLPGEGSVRCAHGLMPVPVPAVAALLAHHRAPHRRLGHETGELTTPTGAALVLALADGFLVDGAPALTIRAVGYGSGHKTISGLVNVVRCALSDSALPDLHTANALLREQVCELHCQVDDATGEALAALSAVLLDAGALDVVIAPVLMKKGRPGQAITVIGRDNDGPRLAALMLRHSPTIGVRLHQVDRLVLPRAVATVRVRGHEIRLKVVTLPDGTTRAKPEADDVAAVARTLDQPVATIAREAMSAWTKH